MSHIHNQPGQHDLTASAFIFKTDGSTPKLLLHRHKLIKKYLQFGGHVELDETPWQAIVREILEETGYDISQLKLLQPEHRIKHLSDTVLHPYPICVNTHKFTDQHSHTDISFAFLTEQQPKHLVGADESKETRLFSKAELEKLNLSNSFLNIKEIGIFCFDYVLKNWQIVDPLDFKLK
jgi:8-oxo-dGTP pyrophosphatase MutT (NUDIX family)